MRPKRCFKCGEVKDISEFYRHPMMGDGHLGKCKTCTKRDVRERYLRKKADPEWMAQERARCVEKQRRYQPRYEQMYPERVRARQLLALAVRRGEITKPNRCSRCNVKLPRRLIHGHHEDYSKPLDVMWVCAACHTIIEGKAADYA